MTGWIVALVIALAPVGGAQSPCEYEDGNPDGSACVWTDPDTGRLYPVDSSNYRRQA